MTPSSLALRRASRSARPSVGRELGGAEATELLRLILDRIDIGVFCLQYKQKPC